MIRKSLLLLCLFSLFLLAQDDVISKAERAMAVGEGATVYGEFDARQNTLAEQEVNEFLEQIGPGRVSSDFFAFEDQLQKQALFNQIGQSFEIDFASDFDMLQKPTRTSDRKFVWTSPVTSLGAKGLRLHLDLNGLEADDRVYLLDAESLHSFGPFSREDQDVWGPLIDGETTLVSLVSKNRSRGLLEIREGSHIFRSPLMEKAAAKACEDDLNCESSTTKTIAQAVGHYSFVSGGSTYVCTGTLLNPTSGTTPLFLTANHCVSTQTIASTVHIYWDYRSTSCNSGVGVSKSGLPQTTGSTLLATSGTLDGTLLQLANTGGTRHRAAWLASSLPATNSSVTCIHHPAGDYMRVSKGTVAGTGQTACGTYSNEIRINWIDSLTEGGSSGSAIFNSAWQVIGDESGCGPENCSGTSAPNNYDWFGSLYHFYPSISQWLNPGTSTFPLTTQVAWVKETPHNYANSQTYTFTYTKAGATQVGIHFQTLNSESGYDYLYVYDKSNVQKFKVSGNLISNGAGSAFGRTDGWAIVSGDTITIKLVTDSSVNAYGFKTDKAGYK